MKPPSGKLEDDQLHTLRFPLICTPKLDGFRATGQGGGLLSSTCKDFGNKMLAQLFTHPGLEGLDGELGDGCMTDGMAYNRISSSVGSEDGDVSNVKWYVIDKFMEGVKYAHRCEQAKAQIALLPEDMRSRVVWVEETWVYTLEAFLALEAKFVTEGYEGMMARQPAGLYKQGRSTPTDQWLVRRKPFVDAEAVILSSYEMMMNCNPEKKNELGLMKRATCKEFMKPKGTLGGWNVRCLNGKFAGVVFTIGGFGDDAQCQQMWNDREALVGKVIKFKFQLYGSKDKPRIPIALGFRPDFDVEEA
jgi:DNA ligase-1